MSTGVRGRHRAGLAPEDHELVRLLHESVASLAARRPELVLAIHQLLLMTFAGAARLPSAGRPVARRMATALLQASVVDDPSADVTDVVRTVGVKNLADGFVAEWADAVPAMLLSAVRAVHHGEWTDQLDAGWAGYVTWLGGQWADGAAPAR
jgi:hemoglobin-like flavoprotein